MAEEVRTRVADARLFADHQTFVSSGVTGLRAGDSVDAWIRRAEDALYQAKSAGLNRVAKSI